jgi:hypothetical protein
MLYNYILKILVFVDFTEHLAPEESGYIGHHRCVLPDRQEARRDVALVLKVPG